MTDFDAASLRDRRRDGGDDPVAGSMRVRERLLQQMLLRADHKVAPPADDQALLAALDACLLERAQLAGTLLGRINVRWRRWTATRAWPRHNHLRRAVVKLRILSRHLPTRMAHRAHPLFDEDFYRAEYPNVRAPIGRAYAHYTNVGIQLGLKPNRWFDTSWYLEQYPDVAAAGRNPLEHFYHHGWREGRDPSVSFSTVGYLREHPHLVATDTNPLLHIMAKNTDPPKEDVGASSAEITAADSGVTTGVP